MKRNLILIAMAAMLSAMTADSRLNVYSFNGRVELDAGGGAWRAATVRATLQPDTRLRIAQGASVEIIDTDTRRIYTSTTTGVTTAKALIDLANRQAASVVSRTNRAIIDAARNNSPAKQRYSAGGVSMHTTDASAADSLSLRSLFAARDYSDQADVVLMRKENSADNGSFYFAVFNTLDRPVYVNVVASPELPLAFMMPVNVVAAPRSETQIPEYVFATPSAPQSYALIACDSDFTPADAAPLATKALPQFHLTIMHP